MTPRSSSAVWPLLTKLAQNHTFTGLLFWINVFELGTENFFLRIFHQLWSRTFKFWVPINKNVGPGFHSCKIMENFTPKSLTCIVFLVPLIKCPSFVSTLVVLVVRQGQYRSNTKYHNSSNSVCTIAAYCRF